EPGVRAATVAGRTLRWALGAGALLVSLLAPLDSASGQARKTRENVNTWFTVVGELRLHERWYLDYDASLRRSGPLREMQQILPRAGLRYQVNPAVRLSWGYAFAETWPYGKLPNAYRFPEHRMWEQLQLGHAIGRVALTHRYRMEQRWLGRVAEENGEESVQHWVRTNRFRYRLQATLPLQGRTLDDGEFYVQGNNELFMNWGANVQFNVFDQNRTIVSIGRRFSEHLRVEVGYLEQLVEKANGQQLERNHTLLFSLYPSLSLWHEAKHEAKHGATR
ncbi:MAG TPA: DUF2490 domain-containing protein, partial [Gemmatimonadaceae bacterium]|nr:DUF2490 domain-containing protein [Gemmatimonadaceae bacterium]